LARNVRGVAQELARFGKPRDQADLDLYDRAEVMGKWVWISFADKLPREITQALSQFGFHWNNVRQAWQHPGGTLPGRQEFNPRKRYGSHIASDEKAA